MKQEHNEKNETLKDSHRLNFSTVLLYHNFFDRLILI